MLKYEVERIDLDEPKQSCYGHWSEVYFTDIKKENLKELITTGVLRKNGRQGIYVWGFFITNKQSLLNHIDNDSIIIMFSGIPRNLSLNKHEIVYINGKKSEINNDLIQKEIENFSKGYDICILPLSNDYFCDFDNNEIKIFIRNNEEDINFWNSLNL
jgi:hypothetical protein